MEGRVIEVNKKFSSTVGLHRDDLLGRYLKQIFSFNNETDEFYNLMQTLKLGQLVSRSEKVTHDDNQSLYFEVHYSPISDRDGRPYKILCIANELTQVKNLESSIRKKDASLQNLQEQFLQYTGLINLGFIQCIIAPDTTIIEANENYCEITGYNSEELIGASYRKFLKADELKQFELIWLEIQKEKTYKGVIKRTTPTNEEHWLITNFIPFKDEITEKKLKYQVLEEANKEIERLKGLPNEA
jgi:methyl-accepting chemotaxis protein